MYDDHPHRYEAMPDPFDDILAQLLSDIPDSLPIPMTMPLTPLPPLPQLPPPPPTSAFLPDPATNHAPNPQITCQWVLMLEPHLICGAPIHPDPEHTRTHFRQAHDVRGNEKVIVRCHWHGCQAPPMQRGSIIRHVLSVHLELLRWQCDVCGRVFSRRGTGHTCAEPNEG